MGQKQVVCDTDVLIEYLDIYGSRHSLSKHNIERRIGLILPAITVMELQAGGRDKSDLAKIRKGVSKFNISLINNEITLTAIKIFEKYRLSHGLAIPDCFIAAISIVMKLELFTYNLKDYQFIQGLSLFKPREYDKS